MARSGEQTCTSTVMQELKQLIISQFKKLREDMVKELNHIMKTLDINKVEMESSKNQQAESMEMKGTTQEMKDTMETEKNGKLRAGSPGT